MDDKNIFSIVYDGEDIAKGSIDAHALAPALMALVTMVDESNPIIFPEPSGISLRIRSGFERGSFEIFLELSNAYNIFVGLFSGPDAQAMSAFLQITGIAGMFGLFQLIRKSKGRKPVEVTFEKTEKVKIKFEGEDSDTIDRKLFTLFSNHQIRKAVEQIIQPLSREGIDIFKIRSKGKDTFTATKSEVPFFMAPAEHEGETKSIVDTRLLIVSPSFHQYNKWRVSDGNKVIFASIADEKFMELVQIGVEAFSKGDVLYVALQTTQWFEKGYLKADYTIIKVYKHEHAPQQVNLL
ncbi:MAG: hypothetical protein P9L89_08020 [Candidatus Celaenobacter polaris]|nr:hypothetical protein [Candidatus Celaenobacter polaris]